MEFIVLGIAITLSSLANAETCFQSTEQETVKILQKALGQKNLWDGFDLEKVPVALKTNNPAKIILLNLNQEVLNQNQISYQSCDDNSSAFAVNIPSGFPTIPNGIYDFVYPGKSTHHIISNLASALRHPVIIFSITEPNGSNFPVKDLARILIHESFHMAHQFFGGFVMTEAGRHPRDFYETCKLNKAWLHNLESEQLLFKEIRDNWTKYSEPELLAEAAKLVSRRSEFIKINPADDCYSHLNFWERVEGTAHYTDLMTGLNLGAYQDFPAGDSMAGGPDSFFYGTGGTYAILLLRLFPNENWQSRINSGEAPFQVLDDLL